MTVLAEQGRLREVIASIFLKSGSDAREAREIADHLVDANLAGHDSHGVIRVPLLPGLLVGQRPRRLPQPLPARDPRRPQRLGAPRQRFA